MKLVKCACFGRLYISNRNRPDIRLNPDPAGYPASISGSGSGSSFKNFAGFFAGYFIFKMYFKILKCIFFKLESLDFEKPKKYFRLIKNMAA